eukprot:TRINITY_DN1764_c0_g1_i2.p1 TRINITY_DN1764_c0_g1~~TRINITY_DN1764_c0_g1_i2.p1  ORF type:complete len:102 (-),score=23.23 TRINITY_DN1764_c0_g1_i2:232-537(-)
MVMMGQVSPTSFLALSPLSSLLSPLYPAPSQSVSPVTILLTLSTFRWYSEKFSKGQWDKEECISEWEKYRACLMQHLDDKHLSRLLEDNSDLPADADSSSL